jgi:high-affinity iron transporter
MAAFLVMLREGVEAALIVAILLAFLDRTDRRERYTAVWWGTGAAVVASLVAGFVIWQTVGSLEGTAEQLVEGVVAVLAAGLLTWMIFWMGKQARGLRSGLESQADSALEAGGAALGTVAFVAVAREGFESVLFMLSTTIGETSVRGQIVGGLLGLLAAVAIGYLVYKGSHRINLRSFFRWTGFLIILFAAGLVAKGIHEFQEFGALPTFVEHVWALDVLDPATSTPGAFLKTMFGWDPDPSLLQVLGYLAYAIPVGISFGRRTAPAKAVPTDAGASILS